MIRNLIGQPLVIGVAKYQEGTGANQSAEFVVVIGKLCNVILLPVPHGLHEPVVISVTQILDIAQSL